ncbi:MAG TPA: TolC family protein, partial [Treponemataceae bacterium]|nr:TolC family protein [Treponemataceae bacterium]
KRVLTIDEAVTLALENNIQLASQAIDLRMKKADADFAWNVFIPSVQATGTLARTNNVSNPMASLMQVVNPLYTEPELTEQDHWTAMGGLTVSLNLNAALIEGLRATRQGYEAGILTWEQARQQTTQNVKKSFYGILVQEESLKLAREKLATSEERLRQTGINYRNGLVPELAYLQTQLAVETQKPAIQEAELNLAQQKSMFAFLLNLPAGTDIELSGEIHPTLVQHNADDLVKKHLGSRLDLALLSKNIALLQTQKRAQLLQLYTPSLALSQSFSPRISAIDDPWFNPDSWTDSSGAFSLTLAWNLTNMLPFSQAARGIDDINDNRIKLELALTQSAYAAELEIRNLVRKLDKSRSSIQAMEMNVSIAEKAWKLSEAGYRAGTIEYLDLKDAENTLMQARLGVLAEKYTWLSTSFDLEAAVNSVLEPIQE